MFLKKMRSFLLFLVSFISSVFGATAFAQTTDPLSGAVSTMTSTITSTQTDVITIGTAVTVLMVMIYAFKWLRRAL